MTNSATVPSASAGTNPGPLRLLPDYPFDDDDDEDDADFDDEEEPSASRDERWSSRSGFASPEWWSCK